MKSYRQTYKLSAEVIDLLSQQTGEVLAEQETDRRDILRIRLSLEEILGVWLGRLGDVQVIYQTGKRYGRPYIEVGVEGAQTGVGEDGEAFLLSSRILSQAGLALNYTYKDGRNWLICNPVKKKKFGQMSQLVIAILAALLLGSVMRTFTEETKALVTSVTQPVFNTILGTLRAISSPMIFLAVCWGIVSIGDLEMVGKIGKQLIKRMLLGIFSVGAVTAVLSAPFFQIQSGRGTASASGLSQIYEMILGIVPSDIVSPFLEGNALQIIFLGVCVGAALLVLGQRVSAVQDIVVQTNEVVNFLMNVISRLVPVFVFLSIFHLLLFDTGVNFMGIVKVFALAIPGCLLLVIFYLAIVSMRLQVSPVLLVKKMLPTYLIALSTASSAAAFATNLETCTEKLGIPSKVANFAIPLGQVIYKPAAVVGYFSIALCMTEYYGTEITVTWLVMAVLTIGLLAMATPPIPGGAISVFTIMFSQLGIPTEAVALAVAINSILDFVMTSSCLACLQAEVMLTAGHLRVLDRKKLERC